MNNYKIKYNELKTSEFLYLWESVWNNAPSPEQVELAIKNTLFRVSIYDNNEIIGMARIIGDKGLCYYIKDVVVLPKYQKQGIGKKLIEEILKYVNDNGIKDTEIFVELCAMPSVIPFYEKLGFAANEAQRLKMMYRVK